MCKYCKKLKEIKDLEQSDLKKTIQAWQRRDLNARNLVTWLYCMLGSEEKNVFRSRVNKFLNTNWIGK